MKPPFSCILLSFYLLCKPSTGLAVRELLPRKQFLQATDFEGIDREVAEHVVDVADTVLRNRDIRATQFLSKPDALALEKNIAPLSDIRSCLIGGYQQAERCRMVLSRVDAPQDEDEHEAHTRRFLRVLAFEGNFLFDPASRDDFEAVLQEAAASVKEEKSNSFTGDIIVESEVGAQAIVAPELATNVVEQNLIKFVRSVAVNVTETDFGSLWVSPPISRDISSVEKSLRLDAVASAGFRASRSKISSHIKAGEVLINWKPATVGSKKVGSGDHIILRGKGELVIHSTDVTAKGRYRIQMTLLK